MPYTPENGSFRYNYSIRAGSLGTIQNNAYVMQHGERFSIANTATNWTLKMTLSTPVYSSTAIEFNLRALNGADTSNGAGITLYATYRMNVTGSGSYKELYILRNGGTTTGPLVVTAQAFGLVLEATMNAGTLTLKYGASTVLTQTGQTGYTGGDILVESDTGAFTIDTLELTPL